MGDKDYSPDITVKLHEELKHWSEQCFCGKSDLKTQEDKDKHYKMAHIQKGRGINPKTGKKIICGHAQHVTKSAKTTGLYGSTSGHSI